MISYRQIDGNFASKYSSLGGLDFLPCVFRPLVYYVHLKAFHFSALGYPLSPGKYAPLVSWSCLWPAVFQNHFFTAVAKVAA